MQDHSRVTLDDSYVENEAVGNQSNTEIFSCRILHDEDLTIPDSSIPRSSRGRDITLVTMYSNQLFHHLLDESHDVVTSLS